jgi:tetratricopeptide (TPR) repeat protein
LTDPAAYFLPQAEKFAGIGNWKAAQEVLNLGLKALPENPRLLAFRGLVRLESARGNKIKLEAAQLDIRQDAEAAAKAEGASPDAAYVLGLLEEELGNLDKAESEYRKAIKTHQGNPDDASRYIIALARLLQRDRSNPAAIPMKDDQAEPKKKDDGDVKKKDAAEPKKDAGP